MQAVEDVLLVLDGAAGDVGVLEAEDERPADVSGVQVVEERGPRRPDVERPGRARGDPDPVGAHVEPVVSAAAGMAEAGTRWKSAGSASPGQDPDERGRSQAERRASERVRRASASRATRSGPGS